MIDVYYWPTPNGKKVTIMLEECALPYNVVPVNIQSGEQKKPGFVSINPNGRIPAIVDRDPADGGEPVAVFESGAILQYLGEKTGKFWPSDLRGRYAVNQWLMWQMAGLGPIAGQTSHFLNAAPERIPYAVDRFVKETARLYGVLDAALSRSDYVAGEYSVADMAIYPWVVPYARQGQDIASFPAIKAWLERMGGRAGVKAGMDAGKDLRKA
ncbi:MAG: glutathione S-transferase N-terminal domain-containing protein [Proteobacteria bacterium]|nr:glutathione S-transferase N-terminal domain-containing protein [Pseudomonadota bacterium]